MSDYMKQDLLEDVVRLSTTTQLVELKLSALSGKDLSRAIDEIRQVLTKEELRNFKEEMEEQLPILMEGLPFKIVTVIHNLTVRQNSLTYIHSYTMGCPVLRFLCVQELRPQDFSVYLYKSEVDNTLVVSYPRRGTRVLNIVRLDSIAC